MSRRSGDDKKLCESPALAKLAKAPKMKAKSMWKQGSISRDRSATYRGLTIRIKVDPETGNPTEIEFFIGGRRVESAPVTCTLEIAQRIAQEVVDRQIAQDAAWANAEYRHNRDIWKKP
jgi:hypothetical protein